MAATPASKLSEEQVAGLSAALAAARTAEGLPGDLHALVDGLRNSKQTAFTADEVDRVAAATALLEHPLDERPIWHAAEKRGQFFVFEGLDRSGKSTQSRRLAAHLEQTGHAVKWMCFPDRHTPVGTLIDLYLRRKIELTDEAIHRLFSANRWETAQTIVDELNTGTMIVCDRYAFSGVAYSAAKGLDLAWCQEPDRGLPAPDGVFFMHIDEKVGASRADFGDERYENADMQARVRVQFRQEELRAGVSWHDVDGARDIETIHSEIRDAVQAILTVKEHGARAIHGLWDLRGL
mmetsp:Transcript_53897/g.125360  ORF Transcript_53897/g.125360 Transcript_53897/m.125360 type:complete len:293 (+) Transcript_53897:74-952(+)|eukprot:CAMPEP_0171096188 /NCGR_PEP_ID=MMETSP0766_2-20121228/43816_1 /TAXON_ID=439317 /ORGANISM="Gambierdiscus australes, Strain CAWD 149" /LENGTH=292 /DNA_ID=CAMNT_0011555109 /DNA_START=73 /DNA_END=951 /DNA_ORIENTATION=+